MTNKTTYCKKDILSSMQVYDGELPKFRLLCDQEM